jgi:hypothetical protein
MPAISPPTNELMSRSLVICFIGRTTRIRAFVNDGLRVDPVQKFADLFAAEFFECDAVSPLLPSVERRLVFRFGPVRQRPSLQVTRYRGFECGRHSEAPAPPAPGSNAGPAGRRLQDASCR